MDIMYDLAKYRGIHFTGDESSIKFFHHYQKLVFESRQPEGLDPYPIKHIGNWKPLLEAFAEMTKVMTKSIANMIKRR